MDDQDDISWPDGEMPPPLKPPQQDEPPKKRRPLQGYIASIKNDRAMPWREPAERDFMYLLEVDPWVVGYRNDLEAILIQIDGRLRSHKPGFVVNTVKRIVYADLIRRHGEKVDARVESAAHHFLSRGMGYVAIPWAEVALEPRLSNAKIVLAARGVDVSDSFLSAAMKAVSAGAVTLAELEEALRHHPEVEALPPLSGVRVLLFAAMLRGTLVIDLCPPLSGQSAVALRK